jgi:hypothetical protein
MRWRRGACLAGIALAAVVTPAVLAGAAPARSLAPAVTVSMGSSPAGVPQGTDYTTTITVQNSGADAATNVSLSVQFPFSRPDPNNPPDDLISNVRISASGASCTSISYGDVFGCSTASLAAGGSFTVTVVATADAAPGTGLNASAFATWDGYTTPASASTGPIVMAPPANMAMSESISPAGVPAGGTATVTVSVANTGSDRSNLYVMFWLGPGAWSVSAPAQTAGPAFACTLQDAFTVQCVIGVFPGGSSASFSIPLKVDASAPVGQILDSRTGAFLNTGSGAALAGDSRSIQVAAPAAAGGGGTTGGSGGGGGSGGAAATSWSLAVTLLGAGKGTVTSDPAGIDCGSTCTATFPSASEVRLTADAALGSSFAGWGGACSGVAATCVVSQSAAATVSATFDLQPAGNATASSTTAHCVVPSLRGLSRAVALRRLESAHCRLGAVTTARSHTVARGRVVSQHPAPGTPLAAGAKVAIVLSRGS